MEDPTDITGSGFASIQFNSAPAHLIPLQQRGGLDKMTIYLDQLQAIAGIWGRDPTIVYDVGYLARALRQAGFNQASLGAPPEEAIRDAINEGYLYVDQINNGRVFLGLTPTALATWGMVYPDMVPQFPAYGGRIPPMRPV
jgi:hypothetical protein